MSSENYIHGFDKTEQDRLYHQACFLENSVFEKISFPARANVLEVGSGVGAQTQILLRRFPSVQITCVDAATSQLGRAKEVLKSEIETGRVTLQQADASSMPFAAGSFDSAFLCWILEHVADPFRILQETHRCLKPGGTIFCTEVMNSTLFIWPRKPVIDEVWKQLNESQVEFNGDPNVGAKVPNLLLKARYQDIQVHHINYQFDGRNVKKRADFLSYWEGIVLSAIPGLVESGRLKQSDKDLVLKAFEELRNDPDSVFSYCAFQCSAKS